MDFTHFDEKGNAIMVDVSSKDTTQRTAIAYGEICVGQEILEKNGFIQGYFAYGEIITATRREILMARMNYGETVPFLKMVNGNLLELDLNFTLDIKPSGNSEIM